MGNLVEDLRGVRVIREALSAGQQQALVGDIRDVLRQAPLFRPVTRRGQALSVRMSSAGDWGWVSDRRGYRYERTHPSGVDWPAIPRSVLALWDSVVPYARAPESCLINWYDADARMGLHQDRDEADFTQPVVSVSFGDDARFRVGSVERGGKTESVILKSGDVAVLEGEARLIHHGVDRIYPGTSMLLNAPGRINLTLRVVT